MTVPAYKHVYIVFKVIDILPNPVHEQNDNTRAVKYPSDNDIILESCAAICHNVIVLKGDGSVYAAL